jgi:hypothetical protein
MRAALPLCAALAACAHAVPPPASAPTAPSSPADAGRLVVLVVVDQLRYADLLALSPALGPGGFAGLGSALPLRYETVATETAAGHATLATGAWAEVHGVVGNLLFDGAAAIPAVRDARCPLWARPADGRSAAALLAPTVGDELKLATLGRGRVVSVAGKDRAALLLAGTSADLALFWDTDAGQLTSTTCYAPAPPPWVEELRRQTAAQSWLHWQWTPSRSLAELSRYGAVEPPGAIPAYGMGPRFPHAVGQGDASERFYKALRASPAGTEITLRAARAAVDALQLGMRGEPDLLLIGLSAGDLVGHAYGPHSVERADVLLRMHDELGALLRELRARYGSRLSVLLASDHGVTPLGEQERALRVQGAALPEAHLSARVDEALRAAFGRSPEGGWVAHFSPPAVGLRRAPGVDAEAAAEVAARALSAQPGIARALTAAAIAREPAGSPLRHAFFPGRSGDLLVEPRPGFTIPGEGDATEHRSHWNEASLVPLLIDAPGFALRPALEGATLRATQVAPTLARLLGIAPPSAALDEPVLLQR